MTVLSKSANRLLSALPEAEYQRLLPDLEKVELKLKESIYRQGKTISHVYFPESGIISQLSEVNKKSMLQVGLIGSEGLAGLPIFLGVKIAGSHAIVRGEGLALRMTTKSFLAACERGGRRERNKLLKLIRRYTYSLLTQISQSAVCSHYHQIELRLARCLLMADDRMQTSAVQLTQEFLSTMLGVRREAVNISAQHLQQQKLISYSRGLIKILDRKNLESAACECYRIIRNEEMSFPVK